MSPSQSDLDDARLVPRYTPFLKPLPLPTAQAFDEPTRCLRVNEEWVGYILGALDTLDQADVWQGNEEQVYNARQQVLQIKTALADGDGCEQMPALEIEVVDCQIRYRTNPVDDWTIAPGSLDCGTSGSGAGGCLPVGSVFPSVGEAVPDNCLPLVGGTYLKADYPELFAVMGIGSIWDFDETHFIVPDMRSRAVFGAGLTWNMGNTGGEVNHTLTLNEIPEHFHQERASNGTNLLTANGATSSNVGILPVAVTRNASDPQPLLTAAAGGGAAHNNMPPYIALKWYIVATPCPEGTDGVDGASILMDVIDGWVVWRQDTPGSAWINLVPLAELRGLPGADGVDGANGLQGPAGVDGNDGDTGPAGPPGEPGAAGIDGVDGDCLCDDYPPPTLDEGQTADQAACNIAGAIVDNILKATIQRAKDDAEALKDEFTFITGLLAFLPGAAGAAGAVIAPLIAVGRFLFNEVVDNFVQYTEALDDVTFWGDLRCRAYCGLTPDIDVNESILDRMINCINSSTYTSPNYNASDTRDVIIEYLSQLPIEIIRYNVLSGAYASYNCAACDCEDCGSEEWCHEIDFTLSDGGFENASGSDYGNWTSGQGWVSETASSGGQAVWIKRAITPTTVLTHLEIDVTWTNTTGRNIQVNTNNGAIISDVGSPPLSHTYTWDGSESGVNELTLNPSGGAGNVTRTTRLLVRGTGTNPFGADNCA